MALVPNIGDVLLLGVENRCFRSTYCADRVVCSSVNFHVPLCGGGGSVNPNSFWFVAGEGKASPAFGGVEHRCVCCTGTPIGGVRASRSSVPDHALAPASVGLNVLNVLLSGVEHRCVFPSSHADRVASSSADVHLWSRVLAEGREKPFPTGAVPVW